MKTFTADISISDEHYEAMSSRSSGMSDSDMVQSIVTEWCTPYAAADAEAKLQTMAEDDELMRIGLKAMEATPEKRAAMIAAADQALASPPSHK